MTMVYRILVCGDRSWTSVKEIEVVLLLVQSILGKIEIIEGEARGADSIARNIGEKQGWKVYRFPANWDAHGKAAGPIRNTQMLNEGHPHLVLAFHTNLILSRGTRNMVEQARKSKVPTWTYEDGMDALIKVVHNLKMLF